MRILLVACALASLVANAADVKRPNILWLIAEDFGPHLGCYGEKISTPNLDRLAKEGVLYRRFYTTAPVCSPSRSAFMTGMYQTTIGAHNHRSHRGDGYTLPTGVRVLTDWLRDARYFTANVREMPAGFGFRGQGKTDWNFTYTNAARGNRAFDSDKWEDLKSNQPFFAQINFHETHRKFARLGQVNPAKVEVPPYYPDHPITRRDWADYLDSAIALDEKCGRIVQQLEREGLADDTIIVFFGDNGAAHVRAKQFCYEEGLHVPLIIRWAKNFPAPKNFQRGSENKQLLEAIDLAPTMLQAAGTSIPPKMQGRSFIGKNAAPAKQYVFGARDRCDETVFRLRTVRDDRYRYLRNFTPDRPFLQPNEYKERQYPVWTLIKELNAAGKLTPAQARLAAPTMPPEELYDLETDPWQTNNLATFSAHAGTLRRMRATLESWMEETNDQGRHMEPAWLAKSKGVTKTNTNPNVGYRLDGAGPGPERPRPVTR